MAAVSGIMVVCVAAAVEGFERIDVGMALSTSPTLITECVVTFAQLLSPLAPGTESGTYPWTCVSVLTAMKGLSFHAIVQCGVLVLWRQHPLCAVMVDASQSRCGVSIRKGDESARCERRRCSGRVRVSVKTD